MPYATSFNLHKKIMVIFCIGQIVRGKKNHPELKSQIALVYFHGILDHVLKFLPQDFIHVEACCIAECCTRLWARENSFATWKQQI